MHPCRLSRLSWALIALCLVAGPARADVLSFNGTFTQDDQLEVINFTLATAGDATFRSFGYAGGTNGAGTAISAGGFDPWLSLFDSTGLLIGQNNDGAGFVPADPNTGSAFDSYFTDAGLSAGSYVLVLSQADNGPNGPTFADGFLEQGNPNFSAAFGCTNGSFCDQSFVYPYNNRTGDWAVDITVPTVSSTVPEPASLVLLGSAALLAGIRRYGRPKAKIARDKP